MELVRNLAFSITVIAVASPLITQYWPIGKFTTPHRVAIVVIAIGTAYALSACVTFISRIHSRHPKYQIISIVILTALMIPIVVTSLGVSARWIDWIAAQHLATK